MEFLEIHDQTPDSLCGRLSPLLYDYAYQLEQYVLDAFSECQDRTTMTIRLYTGDAPAAGQKTHTARPLAEWSWKGDRPVSLPGLPFSRIFQK